VLSLAVAAAAGPLPVSQRRHGMDAPVHGSTRLLFFAFFTF
jgi:hypothetical protein